MTSPILSPDLDNLKRCSKCGELYPATTEYFTPRRGSTDGLRGQCRRCISSADKLRVRAPRPGRKQTKKYARNRDKAREYQRQYRREHPQPRITTEKRREYDQRYLSTEKGRASQKAKEQRRRAKERGIEADCSAADLLAVRKSQTDEHGRLICWRCHQPITDTPHLDHFIPLDKGGKHIAGNLHFMHAKCNLDKANKHPHELGMLI